MNPSSSEIEREVEASRANVEGTVEALKDKMSIGQMFDEATRYLGDTGGSELVGNLGRQMRDNPLPLALVGIGLAWLMSGRGRPHISSGMSGSGGYRSGFGSLDEDEYQRTFGDSSGTYETWDDGGSYSGSEGPSRSDAVRRRVHDVRDAAAGAASGIGSAAGGLASGIASAASGVASGVGAVASGLTTAASVLGSTASHLGRTAYSAAGSVAGGASSGAGAAWRGGSEAYRGASHLSAGAYSGASRLGRGARRSFSDVMESEPLVAAAVGVAIGAAIGALLPRTEYEDRAFGDTRDRLREDAEAYAREQFERGKAVAEEAYRTAKSEAEAHGLTSLGGDSVAGKIGEVARATFERAKEKAAEEGLVSGGNQDQGSTAGGGDYRSSGL